MPNRDQGMLEGMKEGFGYVWASPAIRSVLGTAGAGEPDVDADDDPPAAGGQRASARRGRYAGVSYGRVGHRGVGGEPVSCCPPQRAGVGSLIAWTSGAFGVGMIVLAFSHLLWLSVLALLGTGFAMIAQMAASNTILQTIVEEDKRGRLMSFYTLAFVGTAPLGSLLSGFLASRIGTTATILICGLACIGGSLVFACLLPSLRKAVRPIYLRAGILKEALPSETVLSIDEVGLD